MKQAANAGVGAVDGRSTRWIIASMLLALAIALLWLGAPLLPALAGTVGAGVALCVRAWRGHKE